MDRDSIAELFTAFGPVNVKRMFSGFGVYADDVCFGLFLRGEFYFKVDATTIPQFESEGSRPFAYTQPSSGKTVVVNSFWRLPERLYDDQDELAAWARAALAVAQRLKTAKPRVSRRRKGAMPASPKKPSRAKRATQRARKPARKHGK